ncbi:MAG: FecR domain-containing protein [Myxococcales bacterium]|nr:FecR domain-containing protein [Myxococcales bacterium]
MTETKKATQPKSWAPDSLREAYFERNPSPEQEQESLARVRRQLMQNLPDPHQATVRSSRWMIWPSLASVGAMCVALLFWFRAEEALAPLQFQGLAPIASLTQEPLKLQNRTPKDAKVASPGHWDLSLDKQTQLTLKRYAPRHTRLRLLQGRVQAFVRPKQKERFEIDYKQWKVSVKGTRFSVSERQETLRVEVWSGLVEVQGPKTTLSLPAGQGVQIDLEKRQVRRFPVPPLSASSLPQQLDWAQKLAPQQQALFAQDVAQQHDLSPKARAQILQKLAEALLPNVELPTLLEIIGLLQPLEHDQLAFETGLYALTMRCHRLRKAQCLPLSTWYLDVFAKQAKMRPFLARIHYLHAVALSTQSETLRQGLLLLKSYREQFPRGTDRRRACIVLTSLLASPNPSIKSLKKKLSQKSAWFSKHCRFSRNR